MQESEEQNLPKAPLEERSSFLQLLVLVSIILLASGVFYKLAFMGVGKFFNIEQPVSFLSDSDLWEENRAALIFLQMVISFGSFLLPGFLFVYLISAQPLTYLKAGVPPSVKMAFYTIAIMFAGSFCVDLLVKAVEWIPLETIDNALIQEMLKTEETAQKAYKAFLSFETFGGFLIVFILMAVMPAIGEELVFRGLIQNIFMKSYGSEYLAIGFTAFWFALIHAQLTNFFALFFMGAILGYLYHWTKNLWVPILAHLFNNGLIVIISAMGTAGWIDYDIQSADSFPWYISLAGSIIFIPLLLAYKKYAQKTSIVNE
jgi:uncharacterized protein